MNKTDFDRRLLEISNTFLAARNKIGAQSITFKLVPKELRDTADRFNSGKPITGADLQKISHNWISKDPLIDEDGNAFVLYIPDWQYNLDRGRSKPEDLPKYHVAWCKTLEWMRDAGRSARYIKKSDIETNLFKGKKSNDRDVQSILYACKNCREKMGEVYGRSIYFDVVGMDLLRFFALYGKQRLPDPQSTRPYSVVYPKHWRSISMRYREIANWKCSECHGSFKKDREMLDVHHINGIRSDVSRTNLVVLCKKCHSKQPMHAHYKNTFR